LYAHWFRTGITHAPLQRNINNQFRFLVEINSAVISMFLWMYTHACFDGLFQTADAVHLYFTLPSKLVPLMLRCNETMRSALCQFPACIHAFHTGHTCTNRVHARRSDARECDARRSEYLRTHRCRRWIDSARCHIPRMILVRRTHACKILDCLTASCCIRIDLNSAGIYYLRAWCTNNVPRIPCMHPKTFGELNSCELGVFRS